MEHLARAYARAKLELDEYNHARQREAQPQPSGLKILGRARLRARLPGFLSVTSTTWRGR